MNWLEREITLRAKTAEDTLLGGAAPDWQTYLRTNERYQVLKELLLDLKERREQLAKGEAKPDDDD